MKIRATSLLALPLTALLAGCASTGAVTHSTEYDDVYYSPSRDRTTTRAVAAAPQTDPTLPPAADGSVANPDYYGGGNSTNSGSGNGYSYYNDDYSTGRRYNSPYYNSWNRYGSGYAYDPFWGGSTLAIGCMPGWGWGPGFYSYAPIYASPRVSFGVSFGWGYSAWAMPMYGYASPYFYDPFWGPSWGGGWGGGWGSPYYSPWYGGGYYGGGGYYQGFYDGYYAGGGGTRRRVTYGPRLERSTSGFRTAGNTSGGSRSSRRDASSINVTPGAVSGNGISNAGYAPATRSAAPGRSADTGGGVTPAIPGGSSQAVAPAPGGAGNGVVRYGRDGSIPTGAPAPAAEQPAVRSGREAIGGYQQPPQPVPMPEAAPQPARQSWFERAARSISSGSSENYNQAPATRSSGGGYGGGFPASGGSRSGGGSSSGGGATRRSR